MQIIDELILSKDLIRFPSITPIDAGAIKFLSKKLKSLGFNCKILEFKKVKVNRLKIFMLDLEKNSQIFVMRDTQTWCLQEILATGLSTLLNHRLRRVFNRKRGK